MPPSWGQFPFAFGEERLMRVLADQLVAVTEFSSVHAVADHRLDSRARPGDRLPSFAFEREDVVLREEARDRTPGLAFSAPSERRRDEGRCERILLETAVAPPPVADGRRPNVHAALKRLAARGRPAGASLLELLLGETGQDGQHQSAAGLCRVDAVLDRDQPAPDIPDAFDRLERLEGAATEPAELEGDDPVRLARLDALEQLAKLPLIDGLRARDVLLDHDLPERDLMQLGPPVILSR